MYNLVTSLGWHHSGSWANREFYDLGKYTIVEHNNHWTIAKDDDLYFIDIVNEDILRDYTAIIAAITDNLENQDCTLREFMENIQRLKDFYSAHSGNEEEDDDFSF